jgi:hypothetical protein
VTVNAQLASVTNKYGVWSCIGTNSNRFIGGENRLGCSFIFEDSDIKETDTFIWKYEFKDPSGQWTGVDITSDPNMYQAQQNKFTVEKVETNKQQRLSLSYIVGGISGKQIYVFSSKSNMNIRFSVSPEFANTGTEYTLQAKNLGTGYTPEYKWLYETANGNRGIIAVTRSEITRINIP